MWSAGLLLVLCSSSSYAQKQDLLETVIGTPKPLNRPVVLIYYANETSPTSEEMKNFEHTITLLDSVQKAPHKEEALKTKNSILKDLVTFRATVESEFATIKDLLPKAQGVSQVNAVLFSNYATRLGYFEYSKDGADFQKSEFAKVSGSDQWDYIYKSNPLSHTESLRAALKMTAKVFSPEKYSYVLITKSHGDENMILRPKLAFDSKGINQEKFLAMVYREENSGPLLQAVGSKGANHVAKVGMGVQGSMGKETLGDQELGKETLGGQGLGKETLGDQGLGKETLGGQGLGKESLGEEVWFKNFETQLQKPYGISKQEYARILSRAGSELKMNFSIVFAESCNSNFPIGKQSSELQNVGTIFMSVKDGLPYRNISYARLFEAKNTMRADSFLNSLKFMLRS